MPRFEKVSTLFETSYGILALLSTVIVTFSAARFLVQHYFERMGTVFVGLGSHTVGFEDILITGIFLFLIFHTYFEYEDTWRDKLLYGAKLLVCYALCFVVTDWIAPALVGKRSAMLGTRDAQETLNEFIILVIPTAVFWFILSAHTAYVYQWKGPGEATLERGVQSVSFDSLRDEGSQPAQRETRESVKAKEPAQVKRSSKELKTAAAKSKRIRIINVPAGFAPDDVRKAWLGCEFTLEPEYEKPERLGGITVYQVDATVALKTLRARSPRNARWWDENAPDLFMPGGLLGFPIEACAVILDGESRAVVVEEKEPTSKQKNESVSFDSELPDMRRYADQTSQEESE